MRSRILPAAALAVLLAAPLAAQTDTTRATHDSVNASPAGPHAADSAKRAAPAPAPPFTLSGVVYANFQYGGAKDKFDLQRAYLTFMAPAGDRLSVRVTADIFQQTSSPNDSYYGGWTFRAKYAYLQYNWLDGTGDALKSNVRFGMLHTPVIDYEERFWPRGLSQTAIEQAGFFSSADMGAANTLTLPGKLGELYTGVYNGVGYAARENDRFKDYGARLTLTPFASSASFLKGINVSPWYYAGSKASAYASGPGTLTPQPAARQKNRYGIFLGLNDPRLVLGAQLAKRSEDAERADTLVATSPTVTTQDNSLVSYYALLRPFAVAPMSKAPLVLVARYDKRPDPNNADSYTKFYVLGAGLELSRKTAVYLDWQEQKPLLASRTPDTKFWYLHVIANF